MFTALLAHQPYCTLPDFRRKLGLFLVHGTILSNVGASTKTGVVHHRHIKSRANVMLGFKRFKNAGVLIAGIELMHRIRKGQFDIRSHLKETAAPAVWNAVLSAS